MTIKQKQHLLAYLGYYNGSVDGDWGRLSKAACASFKSAFGMVADGECDEATEKALKHAVAYGIETKDFWEEIKYFKKSEFKCKCGKCGGFPAEPQEALVRAEDKTREHFGVPINNSSGVRCKAHNAAVGGVVNSRHLTGKAVDFCVQGKTATQVLAFVQTLPEIRYAYAIDGIYVHMDID